MKNFFLRLILKCAVLLLVSGTGAFAQAAETNAAPRVAPALVRSVFVDDPRNGKDPFFPGSKRRLEVMELTSAATNPAPVASALFNGLTLKGISGLKGQRLALINSSTVSVGEQTDIRIGLQFIKIRCREIRDSSVLIELVAGGEVRELKLREGI